MEEDLNIIQKQCSIEDRKEAEALYARANSDVSLAITMYLDPNYSPPTALYDKFSEFRKILDDKDTALQGVLGRENCPKPEESEKVDKDDVDDVEVGEVSHEQVGIEEYKGS